MTEKGGAHQSAEGHFSIRARNYDSSAAWVDDPVLIKLIYDLAEPQAHSRVLDLAIGTGKVASAFYGRVRYVAGIDVCPEMVKHAGGCADEVIMCRAEKLSFADNSFDICVCRQGLQFMHLETALSEVRRVLAPGGIAVFCHLAAYGDMDREITFAIQRLRNPARKNFFMPDDMGTAMERAGFREVERIDYLTRESINRWTDHGAISEEDRQRIRDIYGEAPQEFGRLHCLEITEDDIYDSMKMVVAKGRK